MRGLPLRICSACGHAVFPARLACSQCGAWEFEERAAGQGVVEETTVVRRAPGGELSEPVLLGTVRLDGGPPVLARLEPGVEAGAAVEVEYRDGIPIAKKQEAP
jgi:uncharacterized protein